MTQAQLEKYLDALFWEHGSRDAHGYVDWMGNSGFNNAVRELLQDFGVDLKSIKVRKS
jgi:hypothetical protein